jgi:hypothetical protein
MLPFPDERDLYKMAYETILEISEPTTIRDFNAYKRKFEQEHPVANRTARQKVEDTGSTGSLDP